MIGHRAGRSPCAHSIGKFFLCYIVLFSFETSATGSPGNYLYMYFFFFEMLNISFIYIKISTFYLQDSNFSWSFYLPWLTQHSIFSTQVLSCAHAVEPTFLTAVQSFQGGSTAWKNTHHCLQRFLSTISKGSKFPFLQISYSGTPPFSQKFCCAVFAHINTEPSHLCKFQSFCFASKCKWIPTVCVTNHLVRHISKKQNTIYLYIYLYFNIPTGGQQFFPSVFVPSFPHTTHIFLCKTLVVICTCCGTTLFHKGSFFSRQFHGIEEKHCLQRLLPKYRLCFRNHTLFWRKGKTTSKRTKQTKNERYRT